MSGPEYRALRLAMGLTQRQLAGRLGVTTRTIRYRETGAVPIDLEAALAIEAVQANQPVTRGARKA